jgi:uncharacterized Zn-binding protein involved in type VI secretion
MELDAVRGSAPYEAAVKIVNQENIAAETLANQASKQAKLTGAFAARTGDPVLHPIPPVLGVGPGSPNVLIGNRPAWRAMPLAAASNLQSAKKESNKAMAEAKALNLAAAGTPAAPAAKTNKERVETEQEIAMTQAILQAAAGGTDIHTCSTPLPLPPHGPGVVVNGSKTVLINGLPASRAGDRLLEAMGPPNVIVNGCPTVLIGG